MSNERVEFDSSATRDDFFELLKEYSKVTTWDTLYKKCKIPRSMFQRYRCGECTISENRFNSFIKNFPKNKKLYFSSKIRKKPSNWGG